MAPHRPSLADELNARIDCEDLADKLGLVRPGGSRGNYRCANGTDKAPSLSVYADKSGRSRFMCFKCDVSGGPVDLHMHVRGSDFRSACAELGEMYRINVAPPAAAPGAPPERRERSRAEWIADACLAAARDEAPREKLMQYLLGRGISDKAIRHALDRHTLGFNTWHSPTIPRGEVNHGGEAAAFIVRAHDTGQVVAVDMRYLDAQANGGVKTQSQGEKEGRPWCSDWRRFASARRVYIVESAINALSVESCAIPGTAVVAMRGTAAVRSMDWHLFIGKTVVLAFDNDKPLEHGPQAGYRPGLKAAWAAHEALMALDVPALMLDYEDWVDADDEPINDINDYLQLHGADKLANALRKLEPWLIPGLPGKESAGKPRIWLPFHDVQTYWRYRVRDDFTSWVSKYTPDEESGKDKLTFENVAGFRVAGISRVTIASAASTMTGDKDASPTTVFAVSAQVPRYGHRLLRRVMHDEQLHNVEVWKKMGPVFSAPGFLRMLNILERAADIGARDAVNFVGLAWRDGKPTVNEGPDCYFVDPRRQCPYSNLVFPSAPVANADAVICAYQATFGGNAAALMLVWALGAHLKAFFGFWPHCVIQADKGVGKTTLVKRLERSIGMKMLAGQSLDTEFRMLTSLSYTSHPIGWDELSARKQELINKAVTNLQQSYNYFSTLRGTEMMEYLLCAPVLLSGEDVPVKSLEGKIVRNRLQLGRRGLEIAEALPVFPVRQWLQYLAALPKERVLELQRDSVHTLQQACMAKAEDAGAMRMVVNYAALRTAWTLLCDFAGIEVGQGDFLRDLTAEMNAHIRESVAERQPWVWIVETLLSEIARGTFRYPFVFDQTDEEEAYLAVRTSHVMDHIAREHSLREFWDALPVKSDRVFKRALQAAGVLAIEDVERTCHGKRVAHMVGLSLPALEQYGLYAARPVAAALEAN